METLCIAVDPYLLDHTNFALTDFTFVREFNIEININFEEKM